MGGGARLATELGWRRSSVGDGARLATELGWRRRGAELGGRQGGGAWASKWDLKEELDLGRRPKEGKEKQLKDTL